ncbi:LIM domain-containing protein WLIM2a [Pseudolycoriella hygida]|uniref:LIM domain-containing protein WLIM2a n=1 Tax=Pseudolycoriella hygida TaxID=35572 RepID=A0A9Q0N2R9_9DIPT|nr:LIM domain-containing protein WLIM2a [Pseudolycoriella hygida]
MQVISIMKRGFIMSTKSAQQIVSNATESLHSTSPHNKKLTLTDADNPLISTDLSNSITLNNSDIDDEYLNTQNLTLFTDQELQSFDTLLNTDKEIRDHVDTLPYDIDTSDSVEHRDTINGGNNDKIIEFIDDACEVDKSNGITQDDICFDQNGSFDSNHIVKKATKPASLRLVITDTDDETGPPIVNKTKKFYETDDAFISAIFSQTITSTTATPTDDDLSYSFDPPFTEPVAMNGGNDVEKTGVGGGGLTVDDNVNADHSINESQTENLDNYNEGLVSLTHTVCLDGDDFDRYDEDELNSSKEIATKSPHYKNVEPGGNNRSHDHVVNDDDEEDDGIYENVLMHKGTYKQRPSIVVDCYTEEDGSSEQFNVEPAVTDDAYNVVVASYFDQTIEDDDDVDLVNDYERNEGDDPNVKLGDPETSSSEEDANSDSEDNNESFSNVGVHKAIERFESETSTMVTTKKTVKQQSSVTASSITTTTSSTVAGIEEAETITTKKTEKATKKKSEATGEKKKKSKKSKKSDPEKENISVSALSSTYRCDTMHSWNACSDKNDCNHNAASVTNQTIKSSGKRWTPFNHSSSDVPPTTNNFSQFLSNQTNSIVLSNPFIVNAVLNGDQVCGRRCQMSLRNSEKLTDDCCDMSNDKVISNATACDDVRSDKDDEKSIVRSSVDKFVEETLSKKIIPSNVVLHEDDLSNIDVKSLKKIYLMEQPPQQHVHHRERYKENRVIVKDVSVKHLCRSFGDLTTLNDDEQFCSNLFSSIHGVAAEAEKNCRSCSKAVYKMEEIKAERNIWHKSCFKCSECNKQLNVDTYESHESILYCKPHFKALFTPKAVEDNEPVPPRRPELIIRENQPIELPPDVIRSSDKADLGLEELHQLNVKSRYEIFENAGQITEQDAPQLDRSPSGVKRSATILSKLARFQSKGIDVGLTDESLDGVTLEDSSEDELNGEDENGEDIDLIRAKRAQRERPLSFANMSDIKSKFESGHSVSKEERREERKQEIQNIRSRLFMGKQAKIKEMYQQAVLESEQGVRSVDKKPDVDIGDKAKSIKDRFEKGEIYNNDENDSNHHKHQDEDMAVFEQGIGKKSRSMFMEMDANAAKSPSITSGPQTPEIKKNSQVSPIWPPPMKTKPLDDVIKCDDKVDDIKIETADISNKFKFFETYKPAAGEKKQFRITPPREGVVKLPSPDRSDIYIDPDVVRSGEIIEDSIIAENSQTTTKMLSMFRQMEEQKKENGNFNGLKPLKRFTPPPDDNRRVLTRNSESENDCTDSEEEDDDEDEEEENDAQPSNQDYVRSSDKNVDESLQQAQSAARAKQLRAKFERWESREIAREQNNSSVMLYDGNEQSQVETAKEIRAKFENMRDTSHAEPREKIKVNRFVVSF